MPDPDCFNQKLAVERYLPVICRKNRAVKD